MDLFTYSLFKNERLSTHTKLTLHKAMIRSVITYASPTWEQAVDAHLLKLQRLQNGALRALANVDRRAPVSELHVAFKSTYVCDYICKLCRTQPK
jgi:hypothetical protein